MTKVSFCHLVVLLGLSSLYVQMTDGFLLKSLSKLRKLPISSFDGKRFQMEDEPMSFYPWGGKRNSFYALLWDSRKTPLYLEGSYVSKILDDSLSKDLESLGSLLNKDAPEPRLWGDMPLYFTKKMRFRRFSGQEAHQLSSAYRVPPKNDRNAKT